MNVANIRDEYLGLEVHQQPQTKAQKTHLEAHQNIQLHHIDAHKVHLEYFWKHPIAVRSDILKPYIHIF